MSERPILFSGPMVRAILDGRKTQTRRVVKGVASIWLMPEGFTPEFTASPENGLCPYGAPGDTLWVRETFFEEYDPDTCRPYDPPRYHYRATYEGEEPYLMDGDGFPEENRDGTFKSPWKPSIHMPREASRLSLLIKSVRVERLQEISEADAISEGTRCWVCDGPVNGTSENDCACFHTRTNAVQSFEVLWDSINAKSHPWSSNPWVWVVEFERVNQEPSHD